MCVCVCVCVCALVVMLLSRQLSFVGIISFDQQCRTTITTTLTITTTMLPHTHTPRSPSLHAHTHHHSSPKSHISSLFLNLKSPKRTPAIYDIQSGCVCLPHNYCNNVISNPQRSFDDFGGLASSSSFPPSHPPVLPLSCIYLTLYYLTL